MAAARAGVLRYLPAHEHLADSVVLRRVQSPQLCASYRGRAIGQRFFDIREAAARQHGFAVAAFCAVQRPAGQPRKPTDYVPHDAFWRKRGFTPRPDIVSTLAWQDLDESAESAKPMLFWLKELKS